MSKLLKIYYVPYKFSQIFSLISVQKKNQYNFNRLWIRLWQGVILLNLSVNFLLWSYSDKKVTHIKPPHTESEHWSTKTSTVYSDWKRLSRISGWGLLHHLPPDPFYLEMTWTWELLYVMKRFFCGRNSLRGRRWNPGLFYALLNWQKHFPLS